MRRRDLKPRRSPRRVERTAFQYNNVTWKQTEPRSVSLGAETETQLPVPRAPAVRDLQTAGPPSASSCVWFETGPGRLRYLSVSLDMVSDDIGCYLKSKFIQLISLQYFYIATSLFISDDMRNHLNSAHCQGLILVSRAKFLCFPAL